MVTVDPDAIQRPNLLSIYGDENKTSPKSSTDGQTVRDKRTTISQDFLGDGPQLSIPCDSTSIQYQGASNANSREPTFSPKITTCHRGANTGLMVRKIIKSQNKFLRRDQKVPFTKTAYASMTQVSRVGESSSIPTQETHFASYRGNKVNCDMNGVLVSGSQMLK